eukprot:gene33876-40638_t
MRDARSERAGYTGTPRCGRTMSTSLTDEGGVHRGQASCDRLRYARLRHAPFPLPPRGFAGLLKRNTKALRAGGEEFARELSASDQTTEMVRGVCSPNCDTGRRKRRKRKSREGSLAGGRRGKEEEL